MGYFNDLSENCLIFTVGKIATPTVSNVTPLQSAYSVEGAADVEIALSLGSGDTVSAVSVGGTALTVDTDYTKTATKITVKSTYLSNKTVGSNIAFDVELESGAIMEFYITIAA